MPEFMFKTTFEVNATYQTDSEQQALASHNILLAKSQMPREIAEQMKGLVRLKYKDLGTVKPSDNKGLGEHLSIGNRSLHPEMQFLRAVDDEN